MPPSPALFRIYIQDVVWNVSGGRLFPLEVFSMSELCKTTYIGQLIRDETAIMQYNFNIQTFKQYKVYNPS